MKKYVFLLIVPLLITGCADSEQQEEILAFWKAQLIQILPRAVVPPAEEQPPLPPESQPQVAQETPQPSEPPQQAPVAPQEQESKAALVVAQRPVKRQAPSYQYMEITLEEEPAKVTRKNTKVSAKDRVFIQRALENARLANQTTLRDIGQVFGPETQAQAFAIVAKSEKILQTSALTTDSAQKYLNLQRKVLEQQEQLLNKLMQSNARNLRSVRG